MSKTVWTAIAAMAVLGVGPVAAAQPAVDKPATAEAPPLKLGLDDALSLARRSGPAATGGLARVREANAGRVEAEIFPRQNPTLEVGLGPRLIGDEPSSVVFNVGLSQAVDLGGGVSARLRKVDADVARARANAATETQQALREVAGAFLRALWAQERVGLATQAEAIAREGVVATKKRVDAGDATALELNVAKGGVARTIADKGRMEAEREAAIGRLRQVLGLPATTPLSLVGSLEDARSITPAQMRAAVASRPELEAMRAELEAARADEDLADRLAAPQLGVGAQYGLEDDNVHTILGTFWITLPIFDHAQGLGAAAKGRADRIETDIEIGKRSVENQVRTSAAVLDKRRDASVAFAAEGGSTSFQDNVKLAAKAYAAGEMRLSDFLLARRELVDTESSRIDGLYELRISEIDVLYAAGAL